MSTSPRRLLLAGTGFTAGALELGLPNIGGHPQGRFVPLRLSVAVAFGWVSFVLGDAARTLDRSSTAVLSERTT